MVIVLQVLKRVLPPLLFAVVVAAIPSILFGHSFTFLMCAFVLYYIIKVARKRGANIDKHSLHKGVCLVV